jgi:amidase
MNDADVAFKPAVELVAMLRRREVSSRELLEMYLRRVEAHNGALNAIVTFDVDRARERAAEADAAVARGEFLGALHGLPITVKDVFETAGLRTTAGDPELTDHVPERDAVLVARLKAAGAVIFGKTNTPTQAADGQTFNPLFGTTNNPWDLTVTPGGSSGGCGAAVAAGMTAMSFGSDIAGSIRIPAAFCGIYGHKPTWGLIPQRGHIPGPSGQLIDRDINAVGPLARDHRDLGLALSVLAGPMTQEALGWRMEPPPAPSKTLQEYRVAAWLDDEFCPVDDNLTSRFEAMVDALRGAGIEVDTKARPPFGFKDAFELYLKLLRLPMSGDQAMSHIEWMDLDDIRQRYRDEWAQFFERFDILLCPVASTVPFPHDQGPREERHYRINGEDRELLEYIMWPGLIGMAYLPSTSTPLGPAENGLPVGVQVVGPHLSDRRTIEFAGRLGEVVGGYERPPGY